LNLSRAGLLARGTASGDDVTTASEGRDIPLRVDHADLSHLARSITVQQSLQYLGRSLSCAEEIEAGKRSVLEARRLARAQDRALAGRLSHYLFVNRSFAWDIDFEAKIAALTPQQVNAALRRHIDPAKLAMVVAGDLKKD